MHKSAQCSGSKGERLEMQSTLMANESTVMPLWESSTDSECKALLVIINHHVT